MLSAIILAITSSINLAVCIFCEIRRRRLTDKNKSISSAKEQENEIGINAKNKHDRVLKVLENLKGTEIFSSSDFDKYYNEIWLCDEKYHAIYKSEFFLKYDSADYMLILLNTAECIIDSEIYNDKDTFNKFKLLSDGIKIHFDKIIEDIKVQENLSKESIKQNLFGNIDKNISILKASDKDINLIMGKPEEPETKEITKSFDEPVIVSSVVIPPPPATWIDTPEKWTLYYLNYHIIPNAIRISTNDLYRIIIVLRNYVQIEIYNTDNYYGIGDICSVYTNSGKFQRKKIGRINPSDINKLNIYNTCY